MASYPGEYPGTGQGKPTIGMSAGMGPLWLRSDEHLARRAAQGDERAFAAIFRRYHQDLYRFSLGIVGNSEDAQDALQATMFKAMRALPGERREVQLKPWLYRIAHNESVELLRRRRSDDELEPNLPSPAPQPQERAEQRAQLGALLADLDHLPERQRGALVMRELSGLGLEEIAGALQASPAVVRQTIYEARTSLRQMEEGRDMGCESVTLALSAGDGRVSRRRDLRAHLRGCSGCRRFRAEMGEREADFAAVGALPAVAAATVLKGVVGGKVAGGGLLGSLAGVLGSSVVAKTAVTAAVVATVGASVADREGWVDLGLPGGGRSSGSSSAAAVGSGVGAPGLAGGATGAVKGDAGSGTGVPAGDRGSGGAARPDVAAGLDAVGAATPGASAGSPAADLASRDADESALPAAAAEPARGLDAGPQDGDPQSSPGQSGTAPGQSGSTPGQSGAAPGQSGATPGQSGSAPGQSGTAPGQSGSAPGQSGTAPGQSGATPGQSGTAPGQSGTAPGQSGTAPGQSGTAPGQSGSAPGQPGTAPGKSGTAPGKSSKPATPPEGPNE